jgi:HEAT repeat protein
MLWLTQRRLKSKNVASRRKAVEGLCNAPRPRALGVLSAALEDEDAEVRLLAATALGKLEDEGRLDPLLAALRDADADVVKAAIPGLKRTSDERVPTALLPLLRHANAGVRGCAAQCLESVGWRPSKRDDEMWFAVAKGQCSRAASFGPAALLPLEMVLNSGPYSLCVSAVKGLAEIGDQRAVRPLLKALKSEDAAVCAAAVDALATIGGPEVTQPILDSLRHKNGHVRLAAVEALGSLGILAAAEPLRALLADPLWDVRRAVVETLGRLKDGQAVEALTHTLTDKDEDVREATAITLGGLSDRRAIGPLVLALKDTTSSVRRIAAAALSRIDENWSVSPEARAAVEDLKPSLYDRDPDVRRFVGQLLVSLGAVEPEVGADPVPEAMSASSLEKRRKLAVSLFLAILCDRDRDLRQAAADALGRLAERRAEPALARALRDSDTAVRAAAERALQAIKGAQAGLRT